MVDLDETDLDILSLLADDARRPYSDIGDVVGLSGPAVSDRVAGLREAGVTAAGDVRAWVGDLLDADAVTDYDVTLLDAAAWAPSVDGASFALACAECGNTVDSEGESARIDGERYHFCCPSCRSQFEERYERLDADA